MPASNLSTNVRMLSDQISVIDIQGEITAQAENALMDAYAEASSAGIKTVVLNFNGLDYMNSGGIGLLVTLLIRANRYGKKLKAFGLSEHYQQIFELTRLNEAIAIHTSEAEATRVS